MSLIKTITEFKQFVRLQGTISDDTIMVAVPDAQDKYIRPILGDELYSDLETWYNMETPISVPVYSALLPHVQRALARFTIFVVSPELDVNVTSSGIGVVSNQNLAPASSDRVKKFDTANEQRGWNNVETLIRFLEAHASDYPEWVASDAYTMAVRNLINSAEEFDSIVPIDKSRLTFNNYRPILDDVDLLNIKPAISEALFNAILSQIRSDTITEAIKAILPLLRRAEAYFATAQKIDRARYDGVGVQVNLTIMQQDIASATEKAKSFLSQVIGIMHENIPNYPDYRDSGIYNPADAEFVNKIENKIYVFGG